MKTYLIIYHDETHEVITNEKPQAAIDYLVNKIGTRTIDTTYEGDLVSFPNIDGTTSKALALCNHSCDVTILTYGDSLNSMKKALAYIAEHSSQDYLDWIVTCELVTLPDENPPKTQKEFLNNQTDYSRPPYSR